MAQDLQLNQYRWGMVIDLDACTGCQACVVACQMENNIPLNEEASFRQNRAFEWIRVERYWTDTEEFTESKPQFLPMMCVHCNNAPCEPVCPVYATYHSADGLNTQIYNRCIGTRYCGNNCPWNVRYFNYYETKWPESYHNYLNPDVTVRSRGIMEKCTFCVQRIRTAQRDAGFEDRRVNDGEVVPACVQTCPTNALIFGDLSDPESEVSQAAASGRGYQVFGELGTAPAVTWLAKVDPDAEETADEEEHGAAEPPVIWMTVNG